jgi:pimeloyl-ACP methyl ester carboxylesterase
MTPPHLARQIAEGIGGARLEIIEGAGHLPPMEKPDAVNRAMRQWLNA